VKAGKTVKDPVLFSGMAPNEQDVSCVAVGMAWVARFGAKNTLDKIIFILQKRWGLSLPRTDTVRQDQVRNRPIMCFD